jgi:PAS domain S-box-containing protein
MNLITSEFRNPDMKPKQYSLLRKINIIIFLFLVINAGGIVFVVKNFTPGILYEQISSLIIMLVIWGICLFVIYRLFLMQLYWPVKKIEDVVRLVSTGDLSSCAGLKSNDELGNIATYIDSIIENQSQLSEFLERIGDGNFNIDYKVLSEKDKLGHCITGMKDKLHKLVTEDARRQWSSEGIAKFGTILRENPDDLKLMCDRLLSELVKYLKANQGAVFLINSTEENQFLEMYSAYAWNRKKYLSAKIEIGEGLIGQAAIEKNTIILTDVPDNFITITSGLGDANPRSVLIVPLLFNEEVFGVMEFASFKPFEKFEIEFVEKLAGIMASTISGSNINKKTEQLLKDSQKLTEELRKQEEEMRHNLEEMNATQEEMQQREVERIGIFTAINNTLATVEFSMEGRVITANDIFLKMMNYTLEEIENKTDRIFTDKSNEPIELYNKFWQELRQGVLQRGDYRRITRTGREIWLSSSYTPALDKNGKPYKVIMLAQDITEKKNTELETQRQAQELRAQGEKLKIYTSELEDIKANLSEKLNEAGQGLIKKIQDIETEKAKNIAVLEGCVDGVISFNQAGNIEYFNHSAEEIWGIQRDNVIGKHISTILPVEVAAAESNLIVNYLNNGSTREISVRTEVSFNDLRGNSVDLLATLTRARVDKEITFTIFAQKISVDLF